MMLYTVLMHCYLFIQILVEMARQGRGKDLSKMISNLAEPKDEVEFRYIHIHIYHITL
jgi:hypothetical protein